MMVSHLQQCNFHQFSIPKWLDYPYKPIRISIPKSPVALATLTRKLVASHITSALFKASAASMGNVASRGPTRPDVYRRFNLFLGILDSINAMNLNQSRLSLQFIYKSNPLKQWSVGFHVYMSCTDIPTCT